MWTTSEAQSQLVLFLPYCRPIAGSGIVGEIAAPYLIIWGMHEKGIVITIIPSSYAIGACKIVLSSNAMINPSILSKSKVN